MNIVENRNSEETYDVRLTDFIKNHNSVLIIRKQGGIGDILNTRMIFEDLKRITRSKITFAIPSEFIPLVIDHPYIDRVIDHTTIDIIGSSLKKDVPRLSDYSFRKDITNKCGNYEHKTMPNVDKHRSDIWADYIGLKLRSHRFHIKLGESETAFARNRIGKSDKLKIAIQPISSHPSKDWELDKWQDLINRIKSENDCEVYCFHNKGIGLQGVTEVTDLNLRQWMAAVNECDIVMTVATCMYVLANALHKPTVAIFGCEDLDIYGKYFPEMIPIQRHRKNGDGWASCPCWCAWKECKMIGNPYPNNIYSPLCLKSITVDEVLRGFGLCLKRYRQTTMMKNISR